jgi:hypothetical protein
VDLTAARERAEDFRRHLDDLRLGAYEGTLTRADKERVFGAAVDLLSPVVHDVLATFNEVMLAGSGTVADSGVLSSDAGLERLWTLSWPLQETATRRVGEPGPVQPITVRAHFSGGWTHGHLAGAALGNWPLQITAAAEAERQRAVVWAIAEAELHERIFEMVHPWERVPAPVGTAE